MEGVFDTTPLGSRPEVLAHPRSASENVSGGCQVGRPRFFSGKWRHLFGGSRDFWGEFGYRCLEDFFFFHFFRVAWFPPDFAGGKWVDLGHSNPTGPKPTKMTIGNMFRGGDRFKGQIHRPTINFQGIC